MKREQKKRKAIKRAEESLKQERNTITRKKLNLKLLLRPFYKRENTWRTQNERTDRHVEHETSECAEGSRMCE